jgi:hypothetical protein
MDLLIKKAGEFDSCNFCNSKNNVYTVRNRKAGVQLSLNICERCADGIKAGIMGRIYAPNMFDLSDYIVLAKGNSYKAKDGSVKPAIIKYIGNEKIYLAPRNDI